MAVYYNEIDEYAAQWLRHLIAAGAIAPGDVDTRSIADVKADDLRGYSQHHFFAGIGGWSLALRRAGWPDARPVWTGSCPCQPYSSAGKRKGASDDRHLWPVWFRLIREYRPAVVFGEQVAAAIAHGWLDEVAHGMETENYAFGASILPACAADAFHRRDRLWFVANTLDRQLSEAWRGSCGRAGQRDDDKTSAMADTASDGARRGSGDISGADGRQIGQLPLGAHGAGESDVANSDSIGQRWGCGEGAERAGQRESAHGSGECSPMGDTEHNGQHAAPITGSDGAPVFHDTQGQDGTGEFARAGRSGDVANTASAGSHASSLAGIHCGEEGAGARHEQPQRCGELPMGDTELAGSQGYAGHVNDATGRQPRPLRSIAPSDTDGNPDDDNGIEWIACPDGKTRPVKSRLRLLVNGLPADMGCSGSGEISPYRTIFDPETGKPIGQAPWRIGMIKGFGNAIDTRIAAEFIDIAWEAISA